MIKIYGCQQQICVATDFCKPFEKLLQNKDAEKFYCFCYTNIILKSNKYFPQISEYMATIIISKVTRLLLKSKSGNENLPDLDKTDTAQDLSEKEIHGLCYITGYILHKLFTKMKNSPKWNSGTSQQVISLLLTTKESCEDNKDHHALMSKLNRGGLWFIADDMQSIMFTAVKFFRKRTMLLQKHLIEFNLICQDITKDATVQLKWKNTCSSSEVRTDNHVKKGVLASIIDLYVRIRSFTYAKDIVQKFKLAQKTTGKDKSLQKNIKQPCDESINNDPCKQKVNETTV